MHPLHDLLDDLTVSYIYANFQPQLISAIQDSFNILVRFDLPEYEVPFTDLLCKAGDTDSDDIRDDFISTLKAQMSRVVTDHSINVDPDSNPSLAELNEVLFFLLLVQDLEDTSQLGYRLNGGGSSRTKFVELLVFYTQIEMCRGMELIESVDSNLIAAMSAMVRDKQIASPVDVKHLTAWNDFVQFTHSAESEVKPLGYQMRQTGYFGLTVDQTLALSGIDLRKHVDDVGQQSPPAAALDILSLLLICKDSYENPVKYLEDNAALLVNGVDLLTRLRVVIVSMLTDFNNHLTASKQRV